MEFKFDIRRVVRWDPQGLYLLYPRPEQKSKEISEIIDCLGKESARAQGLRSIITTSVKFFSSSDNKIYLKCEGHKIVGILKTGIRKLFYSNEIGKIIEMSPVCLLDFYVHESCQRSGYGKELYEFMLKTENTTPNRIAIDRPSSKLIAFMRKHYNLSDFIPQNNNFVIYRQYFSSDFNYQRPLEEIKSNYRPITQNYERVENDYSLKNDGMDRKKTQYQEKSPVYERNVGVYAKSIIANKAVSQECQPREENKRNYAPIPPWATTSKFSLPNTTSSQYGIHAYRK